jgi:hypothetical protein
MTSPGEGEELRRASPLEGKLVRLRPLEPDDAARLNPMFSDPEVLEHLSFAFPQSEAGFREFVTSARRDDSRLVLAIERQGGEAIGGIDLRAIDPLNRTATLGIWIGRPHLNRGYGTDSGRPRHEPAGGGSRRGLRPGRVRPPRPTGPRGGLLQDLRRPDQRRVLVGRHPLLQRAPGHHHRHAAVGAAVEELATGDVGVRPRPRPDRRPGRPASRRCSSNPPPWRPCRGAATGTPSWGALPCFRTRPRTRATGRGVTCHRRPVRWEPG